MRTPDSIKEEKIAQLYNCLDELKFYEMNSKLEDYEYLYRYIYDSIYKMNDLESEEAIKYYNEKINVNNILDKLDGYNIRLK